MAHERIDINRDIMGGKPVIRGTRASVELVLRKLGAGTPPEAVRADHPRLTLDDIRAAQTFAADHLADTAVRLGRYFGNGAQFWLDLQGQHDIGVVEREKGAEIAKRVRPADAGAVIRPAGWKEVLLISSGVAEQENRLLPVQWTKPRKCNRSSFGLNWGFEVGALSITCAYSI